MLVLKAARQLAGIAVGRAPGLYLNAIATEEERRVKKVRIILSAIEKVRQSKESESVAQERTKLKHSVVLAL